MKLKKFENGNINMKLEKSDKFYMDKFDTFFDDQDKLDKEKIELKNINKNEVIFEDAIKEVYSISKKHGKILSKDVSKKKLTNFSEEAYLNPFVVDDAFEYAESGFLHDSVNEVEDALPGVEFSQDPDNDEDPDDMEEYEDEIPEDEKDEMDRADEILKNIDLGTIDNATKAALIQAIMDSAQNSEAIEDDDGEEIDSEEEFDIFIQTVQDTIDSYQSDEIEAEEEDMEDIDFDNEEEEEVPAERRGRRRRS